MYSMSFTLCVFEGKGSYIIHGTFLGQQLHQVLNKEYTTISGTLITRTEMVLEHWFTWHSAT
jgi:hypothetical protein